MLQQFLLPLANKTGFQFCKAPCLELRSYKYISRVNRNFNSGQFVELLQDVVLNVLLHNQMVISCHPNALFPIDLLIC